ncbi:MAG: PspC domain-containing protein [Serpentinimonas sp.]|jgi:phage shock protein PspC (stress-responsive transcriptional regulator)|nr:PspC domain-containing protein [Serpentinimonas sp.]
MIANELDRLAALHDSGKLSDDEYQRAKARVIEGFAPTPAPGARRMRRSRQERWLGGVCSGMARFVGLEAWLMRLLFVALLLMGGFGVLAYVLLWIFMPSD